jgi:hypothetical protein
MEVNMTYRLGSWEVGRLTDMDLNGTSNHSDVLVRQSVVCGNKTGYSTKLELNDGLRW